MTAPAARSSAFAPRLVNADWNFWPNGFDRTSIWRACGELGFDAIELGVYQPDDELSPAAMRATTRLAAETGLGVQAVLFSMPAARWSDGGLASPRESGRAVAAIVETARRAADLGAQVLGVWPGADRPEGGSQDGADSDGWARTVDALDAVAAAAEPLGLAVAVEYKPGQLVAGADDALRLADSLDRSALGVLVDTAHALAGGEDLAILPSRLGDRLVHVHLGDSAGDADADLPPGCQHDFVPFLSGLSATGYAGTLSFDLYGCVESGATTGTDASAQGLGYIRTALVEVTP